MDRACLHGRGKRRAITDDKGGFRKPRIALRMTRASLVATLSFQTRTTHCRDDGEKDEPVACWITLIGLSQNLFQNASAADGEGLSILN